MMAIEIVHYITAKAKGKFGEVALKLILAKHMINYTRNIYVILWFKWVFPLVGLVGSCFVLR